MKTLSVFLIRLALVLCAWNFELVAQNSDAGALAIKSITGNHVVLQGGQKIKLHPNGKANTAVFFLIRHAEKASSSDDAALTSEGARRATRLATLLKGCKIDHCYSTNYRRTLLTARPLSKTQRLKIESYDGGKLKPFANQLLANPFGRRTVIVGHSNTTPALVNLLIKNAVYENIPDNDYDDLFVVILTKGKKPVVHKLKY